MIFIWRNDDGLWPHGHITSVGETLEAARERDKKNAEHIPEKVLERILTEEPVQTVDVKSRPETGMATMLVAIGLTNTN